MRGIPGQPDAARAVAVGQQQVLLPLAHIQHLVVDRRAHHLLELPRHGGIVLDDGVQGPVPRRILHDEEGIRVVGDVVVPSAARPVAHRQPVVEVVGPVQRLPQPKDVALARQADAEVAADRAAAAVAADKVSRADLAHGTVALRVPQGRGDAGPVLVQGLEPRAVGDRHPRQRLGRLAQQGLQRVLRDQLIGFGRKRRVLGPCDLVTRLGDRGIVEPEPRTFGHRADDPDVHRHVRRQPRLADAPGQPHAAEDLHRPGVAAFHLRQELRPRLPVDQQAADPPLAEVDGKGQADGSGADDQDFGFAWHIRHGATVAARPGRSSGSAPPFPLAERRSCGALRPRSGGP